MRSEHDLAALTILRHDHARGRPRTTKIAGAIAAVAAVAGCAWIAWNERPAPEAKPAPIVVKAPPNDGALFEATGYLVAERQAKITPSTLRSA